MKILIDGKLRDYNNDLFLNGEKISFKEGSHVDFDKRGMYIVPGFIDQHIHGAGGFDTMMEDSNAVNEISKNLVKEGTTSFFPTTMTFDLQVTKKVLGNIKNAMNNTQGAKVCGAHLEGPFISPDFIGAQNPVYQIEPSVEILKMLDPDNIVKIVTYAPELDEDLVFTKYLSDNNIVASVGHSGLSCQDCIKAVQKGLSDVTHFHNAQSGHHHRTPGIVTAGFMEDKLNVELIADKIHVHPDVMNMIYRVKKKEKISLITDSMSAKYMPDGTYDLGGQEVFKTEHEARLKDGTLAGSVLKLSDAVRNMVEVTDATLEDAVYMASTTPAKLFKLEGVGEIKDGYFFDIVILNENLEVIQTFVNGKEKYGKKGA